MKALTGLPQQHRCQRTLHLQPTARLFWPHLGPPDKGGEFYVSFTVVMKNAGLCRCHHGTKEMGSGSLILALPLLCGFGTFTPPF